jgi:hypothetical protein
MEILVDRNGVFSIYDLESGYFVKEEREWLKEFGYFERPRLSARILKESEIAEVKQGLKKIEEQEAILSELFKKGVKDV